MKSYLEILKDKAAEYDIPLLQAFKSASIPTSTFYRTINGETELRHDTARRVMKSLEKLHALEAAREYTRQLRESGGRVDRRKIRAQFKPRSTST